MEAWEKRDSFTCEEEPPVEYRIPWDSGVAAAVDLFGNEVPLEITGGIITLKLSVDPVIIRIAS